MVGLWTTVWLAVALVTLERSGHEVAELLDAQLAQTAHVLRQITLTGSLPDFEGTPQTMLPLGHPYETKISFQLWRADELISIFGGAPEEPLASEPGYSDHQIADTRWRVFGLPTGQPDEVVYVGQSYSIRQELIQFLTIHALAPVLWSLPLTVLLIWFAVTDGLRPLRRVAREIEGRSSDLLMPFDERTVPAEIRPLASALNDLLDQLKHAFEKERRFAADASHELRTPLAAIRTYAQIAQRSRDDVERTEALDRLIRGVDRAAHLVSQMLVLARLEREASDVERGAGSLTAVVTRELEEQIPLAREKSIQVAESFPEDDPCVVTVHPSVLGVLVGNLIENAIKYTPDGGQVGVSVADGGDRAVLQIANSGQGVPAADRERLFERFYRPDGQSESGAGLGLSIVRRICELHGAKIDLQGGPDGCGLVVEITFPTALAGRL